MAMIRRADLSDLTRDSYVLDLANIAAEGEALRERARRESEAIVTRARHEHQRLVAGGAEEGRARGHSEGLAEGTKQGVAQGKRTALEERRAELTKVESAWKEAVRSFAAERDELLAAGRRDILRLALKLAERVVKRTVEVDPAVVQDQVAAALAQTARKTRVVAAVHPDDLALTRECLPELVSGGISDGNVELVSDAALARGSCVLRTEAGGEIDASIDTQIERIARAILPSDAPDERARRVAA